MVLLKREGVTLMDGLAQGVGRLVVECALSYHFEFSEFKYNINEFRSSK